MKFEEISKDYKIDIFEDDLMDIFKKDKELEFEIMTNSKEVVAYIAYKDLSISNDVYHIFVKKEYRKKGLASKLLNDIFTKDILVEVDEKNIGAIKLYKKEGFTEIKRIKSYYKNGNDALVLIKCYN